METGVAVQPQYVVARSVLHLIVTLRILEILVIVVLIVFGVLPIGFQLLLGFGPVDVLVAGTAADDVGGVDLFHVFIVVVWGKALLVGIEV